MSQFRAYLQLMRLPAVFTAMADILLGFLLTHRSLDEGPRQFGLLLLASSCLYLSGMVLNDVFDRHIDAKERPDRPIPSGRVSLRNAVVLGCVLMAGGVAAAAVMGRASLHIAIGIIVGILLYDALLKTTFLGPVVMGGCRLMNVMLGASATFTVWARPQIYVAAAMGVYVAGITWFARNEASRSRRAELLGALGVVNLGYAGLVVFVATWPGEADITVILLMLAAIVGSVDRRLILAIWEPAPDKIQAAVRTMLLSIVTLDATLILFKTGNLIFAISTAALLIPAMVLGRWLYLT